MIIYDHSQFGTSIMVVSVTIAIIGILLMKSNSLVAYSMLLISIFITLLFFRLHVTVSSDKVQWSFGIGVINGQQEISQATSASIVRNPWYSGWGVRTMSNGRLYNVSGFDAVEIALKDGQVIRLGTDQPEQLSTAIQVALAPSQQQPDSKQIQPL